MRADPQIRELRAIGKKPGLPADWKDFVVLGEDGDWEFECIKCGACCLDIRWVYPGLADENGRCKHLLDDMTCEIWEDRPYWCNRAKLPKNRQPSALGMAKSCSYQRARNLPDDVAEDPS